MDKLVRLGIGLVVGVWVARYLGPEQFGILSYALAFVAIFSGIAIFGIDGTVVRELVLHPGKKNEILGSAFGLKLLASIVAVVFTLTCIIQLRNQSDEIILIVAIVSLGMIFQSFDFIDLYFQSRLKSKYTVFAKHGAFLLASIFKIGLILNNSPLMYFAIVGVLEIGLGVVGLIAMYRTTGNHLRELVFRYSLASKLAVAGFPLLLSGSTVLLIMNLDRILLGQMKGDYEVGLYSAAYQLSSYWYMIPVLIGTTIAPILTREYERNKNDYVSKLQKIYTALTFTAIIIGMFFYFLSNDVIIFLFGMQYSGAEKILSVQIWAAIFISHVSIRTRAFIIEECQIYVTAISLLTLIMSIALNIYLIDLYGALGSAYASLSSWIFCAAICPLFWKRTRTSAYMFFKSFNPLTLRA